ncbi:hypothetical protein [Methylocystis parvus]|uniref:Uncharacterized protein n=1 Tax=Methylocystis parvus TaxID=134 RepID=A0A6B8MBR2_9HYPH|nr:hypothetical protein [Methylocystis parvus]QGM99212.1 hypothetical protein F7D14_18130 [Methylocystis parvus]WBK00407.1 hypothetical protein MMG94_01400 [Methylocystis parvus OBBP]
MSQPIIEFWNETPNPVVNLMPPSTGSAVVYDPGKTVRGLLNTAEIWDSPYEQAIMGCGNAVTGPGGFFWVWDNLNGAILYQPAGVREPQLLTRYNGNSGIIMIYTAQGRLSGRQA